MFRLTGQLADFCPCLATLFPGCLDACANPQASNPKKTKACVELSHWHVKCISTIADALKDLSLFRIPRSREHVTNFPAAIRLVRHAERGELLQIDGENRSEQDPGILVGHRDRIDRRKTGRSRSSPDRRTFVGGRMRFDGVRLRCQRLSAVQETGPLMDTDER